MQAKDNDLADPPRESIRLEQDINPPVSERLDSNFSPMTAIFAAANALGKP